MSNIAIEFENVSKQYRLGTIGTGTLSHDLNRWWHLIRGKEDPYLKVGEVNDRSAKATSDYVWALRDISFKVEQGEVLGIIGKNGAGKSTLLKILSRVTSPTIGSIRAKGRIASLLEVGTGFHTEMTGRENIYMNGAIMGMTRREITSKLDEIIAFSGIEKYIDTPVKRYSSGMTVRLGFAVAAHLEPEILVVDEVLAVGDAEFQKKAIGKMKDVSQGGGRTVLFVSHNMGAVQNLCTKGVLLSNGTVAKTGEINDVISYYLSEETPTGIINNYWSHNEAPGTEKIKIKSAYIDYKGEYLSVNTPFDIVTEFWCEEEGFPVNVSMVLYNMKEECIFNIFTENKPLKKGLHRAIFHIPARFMNSGNFYVNNMFVTNGQPHFYHQHAHSFEITDERVDVGWYGEWIGAVRPEFIDREYYFVNE
ncbi:MAG: polysaccharide ABC transporter ATP-binding protein [Dysgonomonas sp.]|nr:polysaccharide ABC transporter ATP-binding protein [Dysgonomonas sp.]